MSFTKMDPLFPDKAGNISNQELIKIIALSLRKDFGKRPHTIKTIGHLTGANLRSIKNWYEGCKAPSSLYFLRLLHCSPSLRKGLLIHLFGEDFWDDYYLIVNSKQQRSILADQAQNFVQSPKNNDTINDTINLNERQKWFLLRLKNDRNKTAEDIVRQFEVSLSTAKRDIADLKKWEAIKFHGSRKTGYYEVIDLQ
jgi:hypothetical protein